MALEARGRPDEAREVMPLAAAVVGAVR